MSDIELQAAYIAAPHSGEIIVKAISAVSISIDLAAEFAAINASLAAALQGGRFVSIICDGADGYYKLGASAGTADRTMVTSGNANRVFYLPAGVEKALVLRKGCTNLDIQGSGAGFVRIYISSVHPHDVLQ